MRIVLSKRSLTIAAHLLARDTRLAIYSAADVIHALAELAPWTIVGNPTHDGESLGARCWHCHKWLVENIENVGQDLPGNKEHRMAHLRHADAPEFA
jgi:hypothetical protein